jgi:hypothetical protein
VHDCAHHHSWHLVAGDIWAQITTRDRDDLAHCIEERQGLVTPRWRGERAMRSRHACRTLQFTWHIRRGLFRDIEAGRDSDASSSEDIHCNGLKSGRSGWVSANGRPRGAALWGRAISAYPTAAIIRAIETTAGGTSQEATAGSFRRQVGARPSRAPPSFSRVAMSWMGFVRPGISRTWAPDCQTQSGH